MLTNKIRLTAVSLLISFTLAGFGTQIGLLIKPMAEQFDVAVTMASTQFSWYLGGILAGNLLSMVTFRYFNIKWVVVCCYAVVVVTALGLHLSASFNVIPFFLGLLGIACGVGVCASSTIIAELWSAKQRSAVLVSQDALFNSGGMLFPFITATLLAEQFSWSLGYVVVASVTLLIIVIALLSTFDLTVHQADDSNKKMQWHIGLSVAGFSLFLALICSLTPVIWLPVFLEEKFGVTAQVAAQAIPKIYLAALIGSVLSAFAMVRVSVQRFLLVVVMVGGGSVLLFTLVPAMTWMSITAYAFGVAIAALYHSFMAWGLSYIEKPGYQHVTFMYVCGGIGGTVAPYISSKIVDWYGVAIVFIGCAFLYVVILAMMLGMQLTRKSRA